ncbi:MAG: hypothetical protein VX589_15970 [Myxococcota bacterium]|nr:hypothetical protein [Myxococcota bacterium]
MLQVKVTCLLVTFLLAGCGGCPQVKQHRQDFLAQQGRVANANQQQPHILLEIPRTLIDRTLNQTLNQLPSVSFHLKGLGDVGRFIDRLSIKAKDIRMELDRVKDARLDLDLDVRYGRRVLFGMRLIARAPVSYNVKTGVMRIIIRHDLFEKVEPRIDDGAIDRVASSITAEMPAFSRALLPKSVIRKYANKAIKYLARDLYGLIRTEILTPMGELTRFSFTLPKIPLRKMTVRSNRRGWQIAAITTIPAAGIKPSKTPPQGEIVRFGLSTDFLAKLGNWAMRTGKLPSRFDQRGRARKNGDFVAAFGWKASQRPLQVNVWTSNIEMANMCVYVRAAAQPVVELKDRKIKVGFKNAHIEETLGPPLLTETLSVLGVSKHMFNFTKQMTLQNKIRLGSKQVGVTIKHLRFDPNALRFDLNLSREQAKKPGVKPTS